MRSFRIPVKWNEVIAARVMSYVTVCFLSSIVGAAFYEFEVFPSRYLRKGFIGIEALYHRYFVSGIDSRYSKENWQKLRSSGIGVTRHAPEKAYQGLTLYTSGHAQKAFLIDMDGRVVHEWSVPFRKTWPNPPHISDPVGEEFIFWRMARLFPNGDLLAIFSAQGDTPWGYGLVKLDRDSNIIWKYAERVHHVLDIDEAGRIYTLVHKIETQPIPGLGRVEPPFLHDFVVVLNPDGREIKRVSLFKALRDSDSATLFKFFDLSNKRRDFMHSNSIELIRQTISGPGGVIEKGQLLVSMRDIDSIAAVDIELGKIAWALRGDWSAQHDSDILDNGHILIFDNRGHIGPGGRSRIVEFDPFTREVYWEYTGTEEEIFYSWLRSRQQKLPNDNVLITEADNGRLFEVTPDKEIVWEYLSPHRGGPEGELVAVIMGGERYSVDSLTFLNHKDSAKTAFARPEM